MSREAYTQANAVNFLFPSFPFHGHFVDIENEKKKNERNRGREKSL